MAGIRLASVSIAVCLLLQLAGGKDLYWQPNSNWNNPSNWALGRVPGCKDAVSLKSVSANSAIYLDTDVTVQSISLPANGQLILRPSVTIRLSSESDCTVPGDTEPMAAAVQNEFIGASTDYWECSKNWLTEDNFPAEHAPCGADRAIFEKGYFSFVKANDSIFVSSLRVRGVALQSQADLTSPEFDIKTLKIDANCASDPTFCPCPNDAMCPKSPGVSVGGQQGSNTGGIVGGVIVGFFVLAVVVVVVIIIVVVMYLRHRPVSRYVKDDLLDEPELGSSSLSPSPADTSASGGKKVYDNPVFGDDDDGDVKVDLGESVNAAPLGDVPGNSADPGGNVYVSNPPLFADTGEDKNVPKLNKYERF